MDYSLLDDADRSTKLLYLNTCMMCLHFLILIIIASMLGPIASDAGVLINDASTTLHDFGNIMPKINKLIPEAQNATRILGHMIPEINEGIKILKQMCRQDPTCYL